MIVTNSNMDPTCAFARAINDAATRAARVVITRALARAGADSVPRAAELLGIGTRALYSMIDELELGDLVARHRPAARPRRGPGRPPGSRNRPPAAPT